MLFINIFIYLTKQMDGNKFKNQGNIFKQLLHPEEAKLI
jgi:hypothetical protein